MVLGSIRRIEPEVGASMRTTLKYFFGHCNFFGQTSRICFKRRAKQMADAQILGENSQPKFFIPCDECQ
jgi:hypothetical protein